ncbi:hypothetical protein MLD52_05830 [Puniceicoccaceae bacterium K14]|nr:hypothetical protein [Puniceicoccaceae bacterium K14]
MSKDKIYTLIGLISVCGIFLVLVIGVDGSKTPTGLQREAAVTFEEAVEQTPEVLLKETAQKEESLGIDEKISDPPHKVLDAMIEEMQVFARGISRDLELSEEFKEKLGIAANEGESIEKLLIDQRQLQKEHEKNSATFVDIDSNRIMMFIPSVDTDIESSVRESTIYALTDILGEDRTSWFWDAQSKKLDLELGYFSERNGQIEVERLDGGEEYKLTRTYTSSSGGERKAFHNASLEELVGRYGHIDGFTQKLDQIP